MRFFTLQYRHLVKLQLRSLSPPLGFHFFMHIHLFIPPASKRHSQEFTFTTAQHDFHDSLFFFNFIIRISIRGIIPGKWSQAFFQLNTAAFAGGFRHRHQQIHGGGAWQGGTGWEWVTGGLHHGVIVFIFSEWAAEKSLVDGLGGC